MGSAAYEIIKNEGVEVGLQQGLQQGKVQEAREAILDNLEARFGRVPREIIRAVDAIADLDGLKVLRRSSATVVSLEAFTAVLSKETS